MNEFKQQCNTEPGISPAEAFSDMNVIYSWVPSEYTEEGVRTNYARILIAPGAGSTEPSGESNGKYSPSLEDLSHVLNGLALGEEELHPGTREALEQRAGRLRDKALFPFTLTINHVADSDGVVSRIFGRQSGQIEDPEEFAQRALDIRYVPLFDEAEQNPKVQEEIYLESLGGDDLEFPDLGDFRFDDAKSAHGRARLPYLDSKGDLGAVGDRELFPIVMQRKTNLFGYHELVSQVNEVDGRIQLSEEELAIDALAYARALSRISDGPVIELGPFTVEHQAAALEEEKRRFADKDPVYAKGEKPLAELYANLVDPEGNVLDESNDLYVGLDVVPHITADAETF